MTFAEMNITLVNDVITTSGGPVEEEEAACIPGTFGM